MTISSNNILNAVALKEKVKYYLDQPRFVYDIETQREYRGEPVVNQIAWMSFSTFGDTFVLPLGHPNGNRLLEPARKRLDRTTRKYVTTPARWDDPPDQLRPAEAFEILHPLLTNKEIEKGGHGFLFDLMSVEKYLGEPVVGPYHDNIVAAWLLDENKRIGLKDCIKRRYKRVYDPEKVGRKVEIHPFNKVSNYAFMDARFTFLDLEHNLEALEAQGLMDVYSLEMEVFEVLMGMLREGIHVDVEHMKELRVSLTERRTKAQGAVYRAAGKKFNLNSPKQKVDILYGPKSEGNQGLKPWKLTDGGLKKSREGKETGFYDWSTDKESLERYPTNPVAQTILSYQEVDRVLTTYIEGYLGAPAVGKKKAKDPKIFDGKVYPDFVQYGTVTGRFSCRTPNLQNIPRPDTDLGKEVRSLFVAGPGHKLIVSDYGQVELVVLAHFVGKGALYNGFFDGIDPHTMTAAMVFGQDPHELTRRVEQEDPEAKKWRQIAKNLNFAIVYGAGPDKVAAMSKVSVRKAKGFLATHEDEFPEIYAFKDQALRVARSRKPPHLRTLLGRKRRLPSLMSRTYGIRGSAERKCINSLIQGSAADLIKVAMIRTNKGLQETGAGQLLLTVHDELVVRATEERAEECADIVREAMVGSGIQNLVKVPLNIDLKVVDRWSEAK